MALTALQALQAYVSDNDEFVSRFGQATQDNFTKWANGVIDNPEVQNSFLKYLINKIGRTYVNSMFANNPLAFLRGEGLLLMTVAASVALDFDYLANVFNLSKAEITARTVIVDNFGGRSDILAIYCDKRIFQNHFVYEGVETQRNAQGRFTNYWLCEEAIYAMSKYMTAIAFTTSATVEVAFDANGGGSETMPRRYGIAGKKMSVPMSGFTPPEGKEFVGWGLAQTDAVTSAVAPASDIQIAEDANSKITLYAIYQAKS